MYHFLLIARYLFYQENSNRELLGFLWKLMTGEVDSFYPRQRNKTNFPIFFLVNFLGLALALIFPFIVFWNKHH